MDKVKIVEVCAVDATMDKLLKALNHSLIEQGYDVVGVCSYGQYTEELRKAGFNIVNINIDRSIRPISNIKSILSMYKLFKKIRPQIVHAHTPIAAVLGRISARMAGVPHIIYTAHGFYFHENMNPLAYKLTLGIEKVMARFFTSCLFTQSEEDARIAVKKRFKARNKILAIGNGVDVSGRFNPDHMVLKHIDALKREFNISENDKVITFIGRMVKEKGVLDILKAFTALSKEGVKLLMVGDITQGDRDVEINQGIQTYKEQKNIIFTGIRKDIESILYITDIFCLPSYREGMPRSIIEAMAMNCAVVATNIRGSREEIVDGETGFLVGLSRPGEIAEKVSRLLEDTCLLSRMKQKGRKRAEALYDEKRVVKLQLDTFKKVLSNEM